jgi:hypothetical protein
LNSKDRNQYVRILKCREDMSLEHWARFRLEFLDELERGEAVADIAKLALLVAAEDDSLVSNSSVAFPVEAYKSRIVRLTDDFEAFVFSKSLSIDSLDDAYIIDEFKQFLFQQSGFQVTQRRIPRNAVVDHPGVWESPSIAYLHSVLVKKSGMAACIAIIMGDILRRLVQRGVLSSFAKVVYSSQSSLPQVELIGDIDGTVDMNACTFNTLRDMNMHLKRAYWPFQWNSNDSAAGGFDSAAKTFLSGAESAESEAISRAATHRLERGVWTSPGAGDIRRCIAACERLVLSLNPGQPSHDEATARRDLGVLYCHVGRFEDAKCELERSKKLIGYQELEHGIYVDKLLHVLSAVSHARSGEYLNFELGRSQALRNQTATPRILPLTW